MRAQVYQKLRRRLLNAIVQRLSTCEDATSAISMALDRPLSVRRRLSLKLHLWTCSLCRRYEQQLHLLRNAAERFEQEPSQLASRTTQALSVEARARMRRSLQMPATEE